MATKIEDLENWVGGRFEEYKERLDPKYSDVIPDFIKRIYEDLDDEFSVIKSFSMDSKTGEIIDMGIGLKDVKKMKPLTPEIINEIAKLIRKLGYVDTPESLGPGQLSIKAKKGKNKFGFYLFPEVNSETVGSPYFSFPIKMKDEIPGIVKTFYEYFSTK